MANNFKLNFPIETPEAYKFWESRHRLNRIKAIIAFSLDMDNANDNLRRAGYARQYRKRYLDAFRCYVRFPTMVGIPFSGLDENWYEPRQCTPLAGSVNVNVALADLQLVYSGINGLGVVTWTPITGVDALVSPASMLNNGDTITITLNAQPGYSVNGKASDTITTTVPAGSFNVFSVGATDFPATSNSRSTLTITWKDGVGPYDVTLIDDSANVIRNAISIPDGTETYTFFVKDLPSGKYHATVKDSSIVQHTIDSAETDFTGEAQVAVMLAPTSGSATITPWSDGAQTITLHKGDTVEIEVQRYEPWTDTYKGAGIGAHIEGIDATKATVSAPVSNKITIVGVDEGTTTGVLHPGGAPETLTDITIIVEPANTASATPTVSIAPSAPTVNVGDNVTWTATVTGLNGGTASYQWKVQTLGTGAWADIAGATSATYTITSVTAAQSTNKYRCEVINTETGKPASVAGISNESTLTVHVPIDLTVDETDIEITIWPDTYGSTLSTAEKATETATFGITIGDATNVVVTSSDPLIVVDSTDLTNVKVTTTYVGRGRISGTINIAYNLNGIAQTAKVVKVDVISLWASLTMLEPIKVGETKDWGAIDVKNGVTYVEYVRTDFSDDTVLQVSVNDTAKTASAEGLVVGGADTYMIFKGTTPGGLTVYFVAYGYVHVEAAAPTAPVITTQPANQSVDEGSDAVFSVVASGVDTYMWQKEGGSGWPTGGLPNGATIEGADTNTLTLKAVSAGSVGNFRVVLTNAIGTTESDPASLTVRQDWGFDWLTEEAYPVSPSSNRSGNLVTSTIGKGEPGLTMSVTSSDTSVVSLVNPNISNPVSTIFFNCLKVGSSDIEIALTYVGDLYKNTTYTKTFTINVEEPLTWVTQPTDTTVGGTLNIEYAGGSGPYRVSIYAENTSSAIDTQDNISTTTYAYDLSTVTGLTAGNYYLKVHGKNTYTESPSSTVFALS